MSLAPMYPRARGVHLLQLMNLYQYVTITQNPQWALELTLGVHNMGFAKCVRTPTHHYSTGQSISTVLNILSSLPIYSPTFPAMTDLFTFSIIAIAFFRMDPEESTGGRLPNPAEMVFATDMWHEA